MMNNNLISTLFNILFNLIDVLVVILPVLLAVAFMTIIERKQLAAMQRRVGPNTVGYYGVLQPFKASGIKNKGITLLIMFHKTIC
jgi:NADH-ubiquinone oxidoreductase chain 1